VATQKDQNAKKQQVVGLVARSMLLVLCAFVFSGTGTVFAQAERSNIIVKQKRFADYAGTFLRFAKVGAGSRDEYEVASDLNAVASEIGSYLNAAGTLLEIYADLTCQEDRIKIRPLIEADLAFYRKQIELLVAETEINIAHTQMPGVAAEAVHMRDDSREVRTILDSIRLH
jgi:hypothetical protein